MPSSQGPPQAALHRANHSRSPRPPATHRSGTLVAPETESATAAPVSHLHRRPPSTHYPRAIGGPHGARPSPRGNMQTANINKGRRVEFHLSCGHRKAETTTAASPTQAPERDWLHTSASAHDRSQQLATLQRRASLCSPPTGLVDIKDSPTSLFRSIFATFKPRNMFNLMHNIGNCVMCGTAV